MGIAEENCAFISQWTMAGSTMKFVIVCALISLAMSESDPIVGVINWDISTVETLDATIFGRLVSPGYPNSYQNNQDYSTVLTAPKGMKIHIDSVSFNLEVDSRCLYDYLTITDTDGTVSQKYCGHDNSAIHFVSSGNTATVTFHSDESFTYAGFVLSYDTECQMECYSAKPKSHISYGSPVEGVTEVCSCKAHCDATAGCIGFDFNSEDEPYMSAACWIHTNFGELIEPYMDVTHYSNNCLVG